MKDIKIKDISIDIQTGPFGSQLHSSDYSVEGVPVIMPQDIVDFRISEKQIARVDGSHVIRLKRHKVNLGDIIFPRRGSFSKCALISNHEKGWLCGTGCLKIKLNTLKVFPNYLYFALQQPKVIKLVESSTVGSTMPNLNTKILGDVNIPFIPKSLAEQERIAEVLNDVDKLIATTESLLQKKRDIKQGTMQQILSGKRRLPGFSEPWVNVPINEMGFTYPGLMGKTKHDFGSGNAFYITFLNILNNVVIKSSLFEKVFVADGEKQYLAQKGDIFFNNSSETPEDVGHCAVLLEDFSNLFVNSFCFGFRVNNSDIEPHFLAYIFETDQGRNLMKKCSSGVTRFNLSKRKFRDCCLLIPSTKNEQNAILEVLSDMDAEIEALEGNLAKYKAIREAMMQQLLTGKIRLI